MLEIGMKKETRVAYGETLVELGAQNDKIVVMDADLSGSTKTAMFQKAYPEVAEKLFDKAEKDLTEANIGLQVSTLYLDTLIFENMIKVQEEYLQETRENLAIAKVRMQSGFCGKEEVLRWAGQVSEEEKRLLQMKADYNNTRITINKIFFYNTFNYHNYSL